VSLVIFLSIKRSRSGRRALLTGDETIKSASFWNVVSVSLLKAADCSLPSGVSSASRTATGCVRQYIIRKLVDLRLCESKAIRSEPKRVSGKNGLV
jgi:hypothetical protein